MLQGNLHKCLIIKNRLDKADMKRERLILLLMNLKLISKTNETKF